MIFLDHVQNLHIHAVRANCLIMISVRSGSGQMWEYSHIWPCCQVNSDQISHLRPVWVAGVTTVAPVASHGVELSVGRLCE